MLCLMTKGSVEGYCLGRLPPSLANQACLQSLEDAVLADWSLGSQAVVIWAPAADVHLQQLVAV